MKIKSKKGNYIMEAAIVLPIIILTAITTILISMFFYIQMVEQCHLHTALKSEAGRMTGNTTYAGANSTVSDDIEIYSEKSIAGRTVYGKKYLIMEHKGILDKKGTFIVDGKKYAVDGAEYVRLANIVRSTKEE